MVMPGGEAACYGYHVWGADGVCRRCGFTPEDGTEDEA
jgi:hypothetical protein